MDEFRLEQVDNISGRLLNLSSELNQIIDAESSEFDEYYPRAEKEHWLEDDEYKKQLCNLTQLEDSHNCLMKLIERLNRSIER